MDLDGDSSSTDEYNVTADQIFDYCGGQSTGTLRVDALMDKFAPFVKTNKAEYNYLRSLLDPEQCNPEISVTKLAKALNKYRESPKTKIDFEESFNLKTGAMPQDSDSGISTDGFQLLEDLQCELREKAHLAHQLRSQLDFTDRQHEEALATLTAERDSLRAHLNMLREENMTLTHVRRDYEEACERLCHSEQALKEARRELDSYKKKARVTQEQVAALEIEKLTLQELLTKSKDECHRMNEMYHSRQSALREENETLKTGHAELSTRLHDQEELMQQMMHEKVLLEIELKDILNKSNHTQLGLDHSIDVSYTEDQMLTALDTMNSDSRFAANNQILDEEVFLSALKDDQGRATNLSLFDEIRLSFCNLTRPNISANVTADSTSEINKSGDVLEISMITVGTQTVEGFECETSNKVITCVCSKTDAISMPRVIKTIDVGVQADRENRLSLHLEQKVFVTIGTQTQINGNEEQCENNNTVSVCNDCPKCLDCEKLKLYAAKLESDLYNSRGTILEFQLDLDKYDDNLNMLQNFLDESKVKNNCLEDIVESLKAKIDILETACADQRARIKSLDCDVCCVECQTHRDNTSVATQVEVPCVDCEKRNAVVPHRSLRKYLWDALKCLFQVFAVACFVCAVSLLYGVSRARPGCERDAAPVPWRWLTAQDLMDLLLRIDYVAEVPMILYLGFLVAIHGDDLYLDAR